MAVTSVPLKKSRLFLWLILLAFSLSGLGLYLIAVPEGELPHPLNGLLREIHGTSAMFGLFMFGYMFAHHVQKKLAKPAHHWDGYFHLALWVLLVLSGLLLYYPPEFIPGTAISSFHWYVGAGLFIFFPIHFWRKKLLAWYRRSFSRKRVVI
jgi:hypothetical protein